MTNFSLTPLLQLAMLVLTLTTGTPHSQSCAGMQEVIQGQGIECLLSPCLLFL